MSETETDAPDAGAKASVLIEALPFLRRYAGRTFVVKYGGHAMGDTAAAASFAQDVVLLKAVGINPVVVHGGGPQIGAMLGRLGVESRFVDGLRVTDEATVEVAEMVLSGAINKQIVAAIQAAGGRALGVSGKDAGLVTARKVSRETRAADYESDSAIEALVDLGFVGEPAAIDTTVIEMATASGLIPVIAPIGSGEAGETFNINADTMAGAIAGALGAARLLLLTDVAGVLGGDGQLVPELDADSIAKLRAAGVIKGGMIPKLETCLAATREGCEAAVILDGRVPHAMLLEFFTASGAGTLVRAAENG
ncbi:acetylglutamate kinase [Alteriqipengyuania lutimaris]|uniref:Acetylglutamate kinase n=1 Tax=Alteriqipengyuania lutimaris TaxID=1538146 RepID=A0A395LJU4_9SPHN|nr:acetylglutamate kinase [Alteriqipengyuania lutimaris]MBB3034087.1 acetylglutamate kinase [Alteriqipengyuania lutimaris]RDS76975.1 acetylglutamate kinase [Alteriqipengyuania lutimaris]